MNFLKQFNIWLTLFLTYCVTNISGNNILLESISNSSIVPLIRLGNVHVANIFLKQTNITMEELIPAVYNQNVTYAETLFKFLNLLPFEHEDDRIEAYKILYNELKNNGHIESTTIAPLLAYQILNHNHESSENFSYSMQLLTSNFWVYIKNVATDCYISVEIGNSSNNHWNVLARNSSWCENNPDSCEFKIVLNENGNSFNIKSKLLNNLLYADTNNNDASHVVFVQGNYTNNIDEWQFQQINNSTYFTIINDNTKEYLFSNRNESFDVRFDATSDEESEIFTSNSMFCDNFKCTWELTEAIPLNFRIV